MKYIYVITCGSAFIKVGVALNPSKRLKDLQTGAPLKLRLFDMVKIATARQAYKYENEVHRRLARFASEGEWFRCKPEDAMAIITAVISGPPRDIDAELERQASRAFSSILTCPHCGHSARLRLSNSSIWRSRFHCTGCNRSIPGRRFFIKRVA